MTDEDPLAGTVTWRELAAETAHRFRHAGLDLVTADRHGLLIVQRACGADATEWLTVGERPATVRGVAAIDAMTARRLAGEPLQYVLGEWSFRHLDLYLDHRVLIPRPETEVVAGVALDELRRLAPDGSPVTAVDLGTGSGAIGLALVSEHPGVTMWLTDASDEALAVARANLAGLGRFGHRVRTAAGSWFDALPPDVEGHLGLVVANPPYVADGEVLPPEVVDWEPASALFAGPTGLEDLLHLVDTAPRWLTGDGALVLELAPHQAGAVAAAAAERFATVDVVADLAGRDRVVLGRRPGT